VWNVILLTQYYIQIRGYSSVKFVLNQKDELNFLKRSLANRYFGVCNCYICGVQWSRKGMTIHHVWYIKGDVTYDQYPKGVKGNTEYYRALEKHIKQNPKRFRMLCNTCHQTLERFLRFGDVKFDMLVTERKQTLKKRSNEYKKV
jgi:5-methylcytosine-specific restriction endonuclease McrA